MVTVAHIVGKLVEQRPFLQEALGRGIINNAALADELIPQIEKELKKEVKFSAVNMAIRRLGENLKGSFIKMAKFDKTSDITVKSNLIEITIFKIEDVQKYLKELYDIVDFRKGDFLTITQGLHEIMIITNEKYEKRIIEMFPKRIIKKVIKNLSSLTINIPLEAVENLGLFYIVTKALNWENINIVDIVSTLTELTFVIKDADTSRAYDTLKGLVSGGC